MRLSLLCFVLVAFLNGCGGSSSSTSTASNGSPSLVGDESSTGPAPGNGIWNYSVATDYYNGNSIYNKTNNPTQSLKADIAKYDPKHTAIKYVFPVFGNIQSGTNNDFTSTISSGTCPTDDNKTIPIFSYYAIPLVQDKLATGSYSPSQGQPFSITLGLCVDGQAVTNYYKNTVGIPYVVPVVELPDFSTYIGVPSSAAIAAGKGGTAPSLDATKVLAIADAISTLIVQDPNAYGVAFDNELAINKATSTASPPTINCTGLYYEALFYGRIAKNLATSSKYLFLFDAPETGNTLYQNTAIVDPNSTSTPPANCQFDTTKFPALTYGPLKNIVLQKPLYDMLATTDGTSSGPTSVSDNTNQAKKSITSYLGTLNGPPVTFVLPASATSTMWESLQVYNLPGFNYALQNATPTPVLPTKIVPIAQAGTCKQDAASTSTINYKVLSQYLCQVTGKTTCIVPTSTSVIANLISDFINLPNCGSFPNSGVKMQDYFAGETNLITSASTSNQSQTYLGSSLYAWRISATSDLGGAKSAPTLLGIPSSSSYSVQIFPMDISDGVWTTFIAWANGFPK